MKILNSKSGVVLALAKSQVHFAREECVADQNLCLLSFAQEQEQEQKNVISWPGDYEYGGVLVRGVVLGAGVVYRTTVAGVHVINLVDFALEDLAQVKRAVLELGSVDVLLLAAQNDEQWCQKWHQFALELDPAFVVIVGVGFSSKVFGQLLATTVLKIDKLGVQVEQLQLVNLVRGE